MAMDKLQIQKQDQNRLEEHQKADKRTLELELNRITQNARENSQRIDNSKDARQAQITRLLETPADKVNIELLAKLASSMASSQLELNAQNLAAKVATDMEADLNFLSQNKMDLNDLVMTKEPVAKHEQTNINTSQQQKKNVEEEGRDLSSSSKTVSSAKEYIATYAMCIVNASPELKKKLERSENELREKGFSESEIQSLKGGVKKSVRSDLSKAIKEAFLKGMLAKDKSIDTVVAAKNLNDALGHAGSTHGAGSAFLGGAKGFAEAMAAEAKGEAKDFVLENLELKLIEKILSGATKELDDHIKSLVVLGLKLGVDMNQFMVSWKKKKMDLGLFTIDPRFSAQMGMDGGEEEREDRYDMTKDDEKEIFINRLRALYMIRAIKGDIITRLDTAFKMRKLKNGLIKLGLMMEDFSRIEKEGARVAKFKFMEMLKEALAERATLYELAGPAFKLMEKRIKSIMSNLDRLGGSVTVPEFENLRDTANRSMYDTAIQELHEVDASLGPDKKNPYLEDKRAKLIKLIARLQKESRIKGMTLDIKKIDLIRHGMEGIKVIQESA